MTSSTKKFKVLGVNDNKDFCEVCGKEHLKKVVWLEDLETCEIFHAGTTCAAKKLSIKVKEVEKAISEFEKEQIKKMKKEFAESEEEKAYREALTFLNNNTDKYKAPAERLGYLEKYTDAVKAKKDALKEKYNIDNKWW